MSWTRRGAPAIWPSTTAVDGGVPSPVAAAGGMSKPKPSISRLIWRLTECGAAIHERSVERAGERDDGLARRGGCRLWRRFRGPLRRRLRVE